MVFFRFGTLPALLALLLLPAKGQTPMPPDYPPPAPPRDVSPFGAGIQRAMTLLATSAPQKRNTVRILFYGQSITEQDWWKRVADDLRQRFPHADLVIENRAIGGFAAQFLVKSAESDLYPFYPDLLIFHVYGSHVEYENIIARVRQRTTADILMQTDHVTRDEDLNEETDRSSLTPQNWSAWMNHAFLPETAKKYGAELLDQRAGWKDYLRENRIPAKRLLSDAVHLNDFGCYLMAELVKPHLRYRPELPDAAWKERVRTLEVGRDIHWQDGKLTLEFEGNRVDIIQDAPAAGKSAPAAARIDGKKPSEFPELYAFSRSTAYPGAPWPGVMRAQWEKPLLLEEWTARITEASDDLTEFSFEVFGSQTGPDGAGRNTERFVSKSGRIVIESDDWSLARSRDYTKKPLPPNFAFKWQVKPLFADRIAPRPLTDPTREQVVTVAQGLSNAKHTLEIAAEGEGVAPIKAIRIYRPPMP